MRRVLGCALSALIMSACTSTSSPPSHLTTSAPHGSARLTLPTLHPAPDIDGDGLRDHLIRRSFVWRSRDRVPVAVRRTLGAGPGGPWECASVNGR